MSARLQCGIIGYGYMGEIRRQVIEKHPRLELAGICEIDGSRRAAIQGCAVFDSCDALLREDVDIVFVCTPNRFSPEVCIRSLEEGKHVFCEKPPGRHVDDIRRIMRAQKPDLKLMFGFNHRFHPGIMQATAVVDSGRLGAIIGMRGVYGKSGGVNFRESWRNNREIAGGGILLDQGMHMLDLFCHFCGDFESVKCFVGNLFWNFEIEDNAFVILQNMRGQNACLHSSATLWKHTFRLDIILEHGYLVVEGLLSKSGSYGREKMVVGKRQFEDEASAVGNPAEEITYFDRDESWRLEVDHFVRCIDQGTLVSSGSARDALRVMEIVDKAYRDAGVAGLEKASDEAYRPT